MRNILTTTAVAAALPLALIACAARPVLPEGLYAANAAESARLRVDGRYIQFLAANDGTRYEYRLTDGGTLDIRGPASDPRFAREVAAYPWTWTGSGFERRSADGELVTFASPVEAQEVAQD